MRNLSFSVLVALLLFSVLFVGFLSVGAPAVDEWPMFHHDLSHSGYTMSQAPKTSSLRWRYATGGGVASSPAVADGIVFVGSSDNKVYALDELTGAQIWNYTTKGAVKSSPAVVDGTVFVGSNDDNVYALNEVTGEKIWSCQTGNSVVFSSPTVVDGLVFVGSSDGNVYALKESTGEKIWNKTILSDGISSPAIADNIVFIESGGGKIYALNERTGAEVWSYETSSGLGSASPAVADDMVFWAVTGGVFASNETSGAIIWHFGTGMYMDSSPAVADGMVFIGAYPSATYALNETSGALIWTTYSTIGTSFCSPAIADGMVFVGNFGSDSNFYALNESTGATTWNYSGGFYYGGQWDSSPAVADGMVFIGSEKGYVYCFGQSVNVKPVLQVINPLNNTVVSSSDVTLQWNCRSIISVSDYSVKLDNDPWIDAGDSNTYTFQGLANGNHTVYIQAVDRGGLNSTVYVYFTVSALKLTPEIVAITGAIFAIILILVYVAIKKPRGSKRHPELTHTN
jgi:outer membrane protein assembly factor BamB